MKIVLGEEQIEALDKIKEFLNSNKSAFSLTGSAGSGKTTVIGRIVDYLNDKNIPFCLCAPTHKAKTVIEHYTNRKAITLHSLLSLSPRVDIINLDFRELKFRTMGKSCEIPFGGVVICDEASMINDDLFKLLLERCDEFKSKIIFVSDKCQLKPVNSENVSLVYSLKDNFNLTKIYRQSSENAILPILQDLREHIIYKFDSCTGSEGSLFCEPNFASFFDLCLEGTKNTINSKNVFNSKILAYTNERVRNYNEFITKHIFGDPKYYYKGEVLVGCENLKYNNINYYNSMDYLILDNPVDSNVNIPEVGVFPSYTLNLRNNNESTHIKIINVSDNTLEFISSIIEEFRIWAIETSSPSKRSKLWNRYYNILNSFCTPKDMFFDNRLIRKKSFDRGYAITVHKSQGSTYDNVYIDMKNILSCSEKEVIRQLQYVALSRAHNNVFLYQ